MKETLRQKPWYMSSFFMLIAVAKTKNPSKFSSKGEYCQQYNCECPTEGSSKHFVCHVNTRILLTIV